MSLLRPLIASFLVTFILVGCALSPKPGDIQFAQSNGDVNSIDVDVDPLEGLNRILFAINEFLDTVVFQPAAATYRVILPEFVRDSIRSFLRNVKTPVVLANDLLQGSWDRAESTVMRFLINTTIGIGGLYDAADEMGYAYHDEDFGQTLGVYGVGNYPYLVLPILGPSSARDGVGTLVDTYLDPLTYFAGDDVLLARRGVSGIDLRARNIENIEELKRDSIDFYARIRSIYMQRRIDEINNGERTDVYPAPGLSKDGDGGGQVTSVDD